jgi:hypothetical protein
MGKTKGYGGNNFKMQQIYKSYKILGQMTEVFFPARPPSTRILESLHGKIFFGKLGKMGKKSSKFVPPPPPLICSLPYAYVSP